MKYFEAGICSEGILNQTHTGFLKSLSYVDNVDMCVSSPNGSNKLNSIPMHGRIKEGCWVITKISLGDNLVITQ